MNEQKAQVEKIKEAFNSEFGRFVDLRNKINSLSLSVAENLQREIIEFKTKHTGKKSAIADAKKLIGRVAAEERGEFGQFVQSVERDIVTAIEQVENNLKSYISEAKIAKEAIDVTLPSRRPRAGHLHPLTLLRQRIEDIFVSMVYAIEDDRKIKTDY